MLTGRLFFIALLLFAGVAHAAQPLPVPIATDSRIKTLVFNENDVFTVLTHYGYQCNIEFGEDEEIQTVSLGDRVGWQVVPSGRRLFLRAMEESGRTNMTVVTTRHTYQFDLKSARLSASPEEELVYVVRFYYPDAQKNRISPPPYSDDAPAAAMIAVPAYAAPAAAGPYNYDYTYSGADAIAPVQLFDDGHSTYFKFASRPAAMAITRVEDSGKEVPIYSRTSGEFVIVDSIAPRFNVRSGPAVVNVYNERLRQ